MKYMKEIKFFVLIGISFALALCSLYIPPIGIIDGSVLSAISMFIILSAGVIECVIHIDFKNLYFHLGKMDKSINYKEKDSSVKQIEKTNEQKNGSND